MFWKSTYFLLIKNDDKEKREERTKNTKIRSEKLEKDFNFIKNI